jgi:hypothetical protein
MIRHIACAALGAATLVCAPALGQDEQTARNAIVASLAGSWTGTGQQMNPQSQAMEPTSDAFTIAVISADGRTFAYWNADALLISEDLGDGDRHDRTWVRGQLVAEETGSFGVVEGPDADGNWSVTRAGQLQTPGGALDQTTVFAMADGAYSVRVTVVPPGGAETLVQSVDYARVQ